MCNIHLFILFFSLFILYLFVYRYRYWFESKSMGRARGRLGLLAVHFGDMYWPFFLEMVEYWHILGMNIENVISTLWTRCAHSAVQLYKYCSFKSKSKMACNVFKRWALDLSIRPLAHNLATILMVPAVLANQSFSPRYKVRIMKLCFLARTSHSGPHIRGLSWRPGIPYFTDSEGTPTFRNIAILTSTFSEENLQYVNLFVCYQFIRALTF